MSNLIAELTRRAAICEKLALSEPAPGVEPGAVVALKSNGVTLGTVERVFYPRDIRIGGKAKVNGRWLFISHLTRIESEADRAARIQARTVEMTLMWESYMAGSEETYGQSFERRVEALKANG